MNLTLKIWRQKNAKDKGQIVDYKLSGISPDIVLETQLVFHTSNVIRSVNPEISGIVPNKKLSFRLNTCKSRSDGKNERSSVAINEQVSRFARSITFTAPILPCGKW